MAAVTLLSLAALSLAQLGLAGSPYDRGGQDCAIAGFVCLRF